MTEKKEIMDEYIQIRCTHEQKQKIVANAARFHQDASVYLRDLGLEGVVPRWARELQMGRPESQEGQSETHGVQGKEEDMPQGESRLPGVKRFLEAQHKKRHRAA